MKTYKFRTGAITTYRNGASQKMDAFALGGGLDLIFRPSPGDDPIENSKALQALIDSVSSAGGGSIYIPAGAYRFGPTGKAQYSAQQDYCVKMHSNVRIYGDLGGTVLLPTGQTEKGLDMFFFNDYRESDGRDPRYLENCVFERFTVDASNAEAAQYATGGKAWTTNLVRNCHWRDLTVLNTTGTGIGPDCPIQCSIENCYSKGCGKGITPGNGHGASGIGVGFGYSTEESMDIINCGAYENGNYGIFYEFQGRFRDLYRAQKNRGLNIRGCHCAGNFNNYGAERGINVHMSGCYSEHAKNHGYLAQNANLCSIDHCVSNVEDANGFVIKTVPNEGAEQTASCADIAITNCVSKRGTTGVKVWRDADATAPLRRVSVSGNAIWSPRSFAMETVGVVDNLAVCGNVSDSSTVDLAATGTGNLSSGNSWDAKA